jgi:DNA-binding NtrC family response regulator
MTLKEAERATIRQTLEQNNWKKVITARKLGIDKNTLRTDTLAELSLGSIPDIRLNLVPVSLIIPYFFA